jgi:oligo-1,6-glucosidase
VAGGRHRPGAGGIVTDLAARISDTEPSTSAEWWKSAVIYQVYPRSFADSDGDGIGDLPGVVKHLDYLADLGVDAIWLSPIYASPADDNGYDISDYQSVDPAFGTLDDFDELVRETHARGMKLIMDLVVNHTSDEHPWFIDSASGPSSARRDWYWWRPPRAGAVGGTPGAEPNNWESFFSGSAWQYDEASGEYYLHLFSRKQPDLNWENPEVRAAVYSMMNWWLDRGVDGFRMDVINLISKHPDLPDGEVLPGHRFGDGFPWYSYGPRIHEFLQEMHETVFAGRSGQFVTVGEMPGVTLEQAQLFTDPDRHELDMVFQFEHVDLDHGPAGKFDSRPLDVRELKASFARWQNGLAAKGWNSLYWNNHDQPRAVSRFGDDGEYWLQSAKALAAILHLQRGTPYIFQGEELGMTNVPFSDIDQIRDIESLNYFAEAMRVPGAKIVEVLAGIRRNGRDNARTPMQWTADTNGGFSSGVPWIGVHPNHATINAAAQVDVPESVFEFYRALLRLRHSDRVVSVGDFRMIAPEHPTLFAFERRLGDESLVVLANLDAAELEVVAAAGRDFPGWTAVLGNYPDGGNSVPLRPWEVRVLRR